MKSYNKQRYRYQRLSKELFWIILGQVATFFGSIVLVRILTEKLEPTEYGQLALGLTIAGLVYQVVMGGINSGIGRYYSIAIEKNDLKGYLRDSFHMLSWGTFIVIGLSIILMVGLTILGLKHLLRLVLVVLIFSIFSSYNNALNGIQNAARQRIVVALHGGMNSWLKIGLAVGIMLWLGTSSVSVVLGYAVSAFVVTFSQLVFLRRLIIKQSSLIEQRTPRQENWLMQMWEFSWPFSAWGLFTWAQLSSDRWALEWFTTTSEVGQFAVIYQLGYAPIGVLTKLMMTLIGPILYQRSGDAKDATRNVSVHKTSWQITIISLILTFMAFAFSWLFHEWLFSIVVAEKFREISFLLPWVVLAGGIFAAGQILSLKILSELRSRKLINIKIFTSLIAVGTNIMGAWLYGLPGVVFALLLFSVIYLVWMIIMAKHSTDAENSTYKN